MRPDAADAESRRVLVLGGYGAFGGRLVERLAATTGLEIVVAGRSAGSAEAFAEAIRIRHPAARVTSVGLDARTLDAEALRRRRIWLVADAAGPFQGAAPSVAQVSIAAGCHYVDIADARDFVARFGTLDAAARAADVLAVTGASSTPALSCAALDALTRGWRQVDTIEVAISPGNRAPRGRSVVEAISSYVGRDVRVFLDGAWTVRPGWGLLARRLMPGLGRRWLSLCETPDLDIAVRRYAPRRSAVFRAGLELGALHLGLAALGLLVRARLLRSLRPLAPMLAWLAACLEPFGTDRGGMTVEATGLDPDGRETRARWCLVAEAGDGPNVPVLPALALIRKLAGGALTVRGALPCVGLLGLAEIGAEMRGLRIGTAVEREDIGAPLFRQALGAAFDEMPEPVRALHEPGARAVFAGRADVDHGTGFAARLAGRMLGFPHAGRDTPVRVAIDATPKGERWTRDFAGRRFSTHLELRRGGIGEAFGPVVVVLHVPADSTGLRMIVRGWRLGRLPLPRVLAPVSEAFETVDAEGRFRFDVRLSHPLTGLVVHYRGWLMPELETPGQGPV